MIRFYTKLKTSKIKVSPPQPKAIVFKLVVGDAWKKGGIIP